MTTKLSDRVRPNSEASPWVIDEIKKLEDKLTDECSKRKQIEELYDNLKADVAPLIKAAKELNESYEDAYAVNKVRRAVKYL